MGHTQSTYGDSSPYLQPISGPVARLRLYKEKGSQSAQALHNLFRGSLFSVMGLLNLPSNLLVKGVLCTHTKMRFCIPELCLDSLP